jgi:fumarylpyruvate hydrolase
MSQLLFPPFQSPFLPVRGRSEQVPLRRVFCVGRNYEAHAKEMGVAVDREAPFYFTKSAEHYAPSGSTVCYPPGTGNYHYEMELVVVIGAPAFRVPAARGLDYVFGYTCGLDMTRRDLQFAAREQRRSWDLGKDVEQSAILGEIAPASEIGHPNAGAIELRLNGETKQQADLSLLIHSVPEIVAHLSKFYHLQPGDVIFTGTPEGVGPVKTGDELAGSIAGVGTIALTIGPPFESAGELSAQLETQVEALLAEAAALPDALIAWKPAPDVWSVMEILCHVGEFLPFWTGEALRMASQPEAEWGRTMAHEGRLAAVAQAGSRTLPDVLDEIRNGAQKSTATIRELGDTGLGSWANSRNPRWGRKPGSWVVRDLLVDHVEKHRGQIRRNVTQFHER